MSESGADRSAEGIHVSDPVPGGGAREGETRFRWGLAIVLALIVLAAAAGAIALGSGNQIDGTSWTLTGWSNSAIDPRPFGITAEFADGRIGGQAPVNSYGAEYAAGGIKLQVGEITHTLMAGSDEAMEAESVYFDLLAQASRYGLDGDTLTVHDREGRELLVFERR